MYFNLSRNDFSPDDGLTNGLSANLNFIYKYFGGIYI